MQAIVRAEIIQSPELDFWPVVISRAETLSFHRSRLTGTLEQVDDRLLGRRARALTLYEPTTIGDSFRDTRSDLRTGYISDALMCVKLSCLELSAFLYYAIAERGVSPCHRIDDVKLRYLSTGSRLLIICRMGVGSIESTLNIRARGNDFVLRCFARSHATWQWLQKGTSFNLQIHVRYRTNL